VYAFLSSILLLCLLLIIISVREEIARECLERGQKALQALAEKLFMLPSTPEKIGRLVKLPPPTIQLPREKPVSILYFFEEVSFPSL
jgi:hypothetical protein